MKHESQLEVIKTYIKSYNTFDFDGMLSCLDDSFQFLNISSGVKTASCNGKKEFLMLAEKSAEYFEKRTQSIIDIIHEANKYCVEINYSAILKKDLPNGLTAGSELKLLGISIYQFKDNLILRLVDYA